MANARVRVDNGSFEPQVDGVASVLKGRDGFHSVPLVKG